MNLLPLLSLARKYCRPIAALAALLAVIGYSHHRGVVSGKAAVQAMWQADKAKQAEVVAKWQDKVRTAESAARAANEVIVNEYVQKVAAAAGERDRIAGLLRSIRSEVFAERTRNATGSAIAAQQGEARSADELRRLNERIATATADLRIEAGLNAEQLDSLIATVKGQL